MNDPRRLRDLHQDDAFGAAFRSADEDGPSHGAETKLLASLGVAAIVVVAAAPPAIAAGAGAAAAGTAAAGTAVTTGGTGIAAKVGGASALAKWLVGSALVVSGSVVGTVVVDTHISPKAPPVATVATVASVSPAPHLSRIPPPPAPEREDLPLAVPEQPIESEVPVPIPIPVLEVPPKAIATPVAKPAPRALPAISPDRSAISSNHPPVDPDAPAISPERVNQEPNHVLPPPVVAEASSLRSLREAEMAPIAPAPPVTLSARSLTPELRALDHARSLLASGRTSEGLSAVNAYQRAFPTGGLSQEAEVLRLDALVRLGHRQSAEARARAFLARHPQSPQAPRIRALLVRDRESESSKPVKD